MQQFPAELTGRSREDVLGRNWFAVFAPPGDEVRRAFSEHMAAGSIFPHYQSEIVTRAGERRLIYWNNTVVRDLNGTLVGTVSVGEDITARTQMEQAIRKKRGELPFAD